MQVPVDILQPPLLQRDFHKSLVSCGVPLYPLLVGVLQLAVLAASHCPLMFIADMMEESNPKFLKMTHSKSLQYTDENWLIDDFVHLHSICNKYTEMM